MACEAAVTASKRSTNMPLKEISHLSTYTKTFALIAVLILLLLSFSLGYSIGHSRYIFIRNWDKNYGSNMMDNINSHGAIGTVISVNLPTFVVQGNRQTEQVVVVSSSTLVRYMRQNGNATDIIPGRQVMVVGYPLDDGRIQASLIRILGLAATSSGVRGY